MVTKFTPPFMQWFYDMEEKKKKYRFATTNELMQIYGTPSENPNYLTTITLPYPMRLSWDKSVSVTKMRCHKLVANDFKSIFYDILEYYGEEKIKHLGIDLFGGCFNFRKMRNGNDWSRHSWGIAIDLDPENNGLKTPFHKSKFFLPEYHELHDIFIKHGFLNLGKEKGYDSMHWEKGVLE